MAHIFISYSHQDKEYVHKLAEALQAQNFEAWIDDRINYGTRWPTVIETAIDSCDGFILVASENSRLSEWVQHELARAQRLHKKVFPLLLSGDPWISFESTQYFDVRDQKLPNEKFYKALTDSETKHLEFLRKIVTEEWPLYSNKEYGFSINYPIEGTLLEVQNGFIQIDLPILRGTNLDQRSLLIHYSYDDRLQSPVIQGLPSIYPSVDVDILGLRFLRESGDEAGMGRFHELTSYSTSRKSKVVHICFHLATFRADILGMGPGVVVEVDQVAAKEVLLCVVSSFTWLD